MNNWNFVARLTKKPEYSISESGTQIARINVAIDSGIDKEGNKQSTFLELIAFKKTAENINKYLDKGRQVQISAAIKNNNYTNNKGEKIYSFRFIIQDIKYLDSKDRTTTNENETPSNTNNFNSIAGASEMEIDEEELPFY